MRSLILIAFLSVFFLTGSPVVAQDVVGGGRRGTETPGPDVVTLDPTPTALPVPTPTVRPTPSPVPSPSPTPLATPTPQPTPLPTTSPTPFPTSTPSPIPTQVPATTVPVQIPACIGITRDVESPRLGQQVRFQCAEVFRAQSYRFQYRVVGTLIKGEIPAYMGTNISVPFTITQNGEYEVECAACTTQACSAFTNW